MKKRLDQAMQIVGMVSSRSQAESFIRLGKVRVNGKIINKPGHFIDDQAVVELLETEQYVSRAAYKLASVAAIFKLNFKGKTILDVGSSTGGFTDYALRHGAAKSICIEVGTDQLHPKLHGNERIELHERTDIRNVYLKKHLPSVQADAKSATSTPAKPTSAVAALLESAPDIIVIDVSFISLRDVLPHIKILCNAQTQVVAMLKPQFEAGSRSQHKGVVKNEKLRREILQDFETWVKKLYVLKAKSDSGIAGEKGNQERFYLLAAGS